MIWYTNSLCENDLLWNTSVHLDQYRMYQTSHSRVITRATSQNNKDGWWFTTNTLNQLFLCVWNTTKATSFIHQHSQFIAYNFGGFGGFFVDPSLFVTLLTCNASLIAKKLIYFVGHVWNTKYSHISNEKNYFNSQDGKNNV